jgi:hypothetical protein
VGTINTTAQRLSLGRVSLIIGYNRFAGACFGAWPLSGCLRDRQMGDLTAQHSTQ